MVRVVSLSTTEVSSRRLTPVKQLAGIRSLVGFGTLVGALVHPVLYLRRSITRLYLNIFRGEPAISEFDWPFTPTHRSSGEFSTYYGSVLHSVLPKLQPAHG